MPSAGIALVCLADGIVGVSFGATSASGGLAWWVPVALSAGVFAGSAQIAAVSVVLGRGSPAAAVLAGAVLNARQFPYGLAVADVLDGPWWRRLAGAQLISDESVAFAVRERSAQRRRAAFWACGVALFVTWNAAVAIGVVLGSAVRDAGAFGLDATFPAVMLALALPALTSRPARAAAGAGAVIAVALTPVLPAGLPLLAALGGLLPRLLSWPGTRLLPRLSTRPGGARARREGMLPPGRPPSAHLALRAPSEPRRPSALPGPGPAADADAVPGEPRGAAPDPAGGER